VKLLYNIAIHIYYCFICIASFFNNKAKKWLDGRNNIFEKIRSKIDKDDQIVWFHCASLGEFEQGRPLMEKFKIQNSKFKILLTFFFSFRI